MTQRVSAKRWNGWKRLGIACLFFCGACSQTLVGNWKTDPEPKGESFYITNAQFKDDGSYTAIARQGDENVRLAGTYEFNGMNLKLVTPGKPERNYKATYLMMGPTLELTQDGKKISMKKQ
jgi:hypothetical protein